MGIAYKMRPSLETPQHSFLRFPKACSGGAWDSTGSCFWSPAMAFRSLPQRDTASGSCSESASLLNQCGMPGAGILDRRLPTVGGFRGWQEEASHLRTAVFKVAAELPGLGDISEALQDAGARPHDLLVNPLVLSTVSGDGVTELHTAVRRWEDGQRRACGPSAVVAMADWPTCFAAIGRSDEMIMGTSGGLLAVARPSIRNH